MTLPSSNIGLNAIAYEVGRTGNPDSLRTCSADAGKGTPDAFSEFHGYSHSNPIPTSKTMRNSSSGLGAQSYRSVTSSIVFLNVYQLHRFYRASGNLYWQIKNYGAQGGSYWNTSNSATSFNNSSWITMASWTGASAGMVDWSGSASGGGGGTWGSGSVGGDTNLTGATYAATDGGWRTLSNGQSAGWAVSVSNNAECYASSTRYYTATFHNIYGRRSGYDDTSVGAFQVRCDATATSNNCF